MEKRAILIATAVLCGALAAGVVVYGARNMDASECAAREFTPQPFCDYVIRSCRDRSKSFLLALRARLALWPNTFKEEVARLKRRGLGVPELAGGGRLKTIASGVRELEAPTCIRPFRDSVATAMEFQGLGLDLATLGGDAAALDNATKAASLAWGNALLRVERLMGCTVDAVDQCADPTLKAVVDATAARP